MQAAFVYTVQLAIGCVHTPFNFFFNNASHKRERVSYVYVYKFKVLPYHQKFSSYAPDQKGMSIACKLAEKSGLKFKLRGSNSQEFPVIRMVYS